MYTRFSLDSLIPNFLSSKLFLFYLTMCPCLKWNVKKVTLMMMAMMMCVCVSYLSILLFIHPSVRVYPSVYHFISLPISLSVHQFILCLSILQFIHSSVRVYPSVYQVISLSMSLSVSLLFIHPSVRMFIHPSVMLHV